MIFTTALKTVGIMIASYVIGCLFYYVTAKEERLHKNRLLDEWFSLTISFIIYVWISKVMSQGLRVFYDPIATLAYPSNATSIYIATTLFVIHLLWRHKVKKKDDLSLFFVATPVIIAMLFVYESSATILNNNRSSLVLLVFLMVLLLIYLFKDDALYDVNRSIYFFLILLLGLIVFAVTIGNFYVPLFHYRLHLLYFICLFILVGSSLLYVKRRLNNGRY